MPGGVSSARIISMPRSGYMGIFSKIVGAHSFTKKFQKNFYNPTKKGLNPDFCMPLCLGKQELSFGVLFWRFSPNS